MTKRLMGEVPPQLNGNLEHVVACAVQKLCGDSFTGDLEFSVDVRVRNGEIQKVLHVKVEAEPAKKVSVPHAVANGVAPVRETELRTTRFSEG